MDLHRIKAMCKTHDPSRCIVCRGGRSHGNLDKKPPPQPSSEARPPRPMASTRSRIPMARPKPAGVGTTPGAKPPTAPAPRASKLPVKTASEKTGGEAGSTHLSQDTDSSGSHLVDNRRSQPLHHKRPKDQLSSEKKKARRLEDDHNDDLTPEQQLYRDINELTEEYQRLRQSYYELSKDQETSSTSKGTDGKVGVASIGTSASDGRNRKSKGKNTDDGLATSTDRKADRSGSIREQRRQLQESADSLAERMENAMRLQEHCLQERQRKSGSVSGSGSWAREPRQLKDSTTGDNINKRRASIPESDGNRITKNVGETREAKDAQGKRSTDTPKRTEGQSSSVRDGQNNTRPKDRQQEQRPLPRGGGGGERKADEDGNNRDRKEDIPEEKEEEEEEEAEQGGVEEDQEPHSKRLKGTTVERGQIRSKLKEPEGYRHRLTSGIRLRKLH